MPQPLDRNGGRLPGAQRRWCRQRRRNNRVPVWGVLPRCFGAPGQVVKQRSFRDPRVKAAVAANPVTNPIFSPASLKAIAAPVLFVCVLIALFTLNAADAVLVLGSLGFLGLGMPETVPEWGGDLQQALTALPTGIWWTALYPVAAATLVDQGVQGAAGGLHHLRVGLVLGCVLSVRRPLSPAPCCAGP